MTSPELGGIQGAQVDVSIPSTDSFAMPLSKEQFNEKYPKPEQEEGESNRAFNARRETYNRRALANGLMPLKRVKHRESETKSMYGQVIVDLTDRLADVA